MKCRACWSDKAYLREDESWKACFYAYLGLLPVKCHHCFHKSWVLWFTTWGQQTKPAPMTGDTACAAAQLEMPTPIRRGA